MNNFFVQILNNLISFINPSWQQVVLILGIVLIWGFHRRNNMCQVETNEVLLSLQTMLAYLESGSLDDYEREKKHYEELKENRKTRQAHPFER